MANRMVVIEFSDPDAAQAFVQNHHLPEQLGYQVEGMYFVPTSSCGCGGKRDNKDWGRAKTTGIPICRKCRKPSRFWTEGIEHRLTHALGRNLLGVD